MRASTGGLRNAGFYYAGASRPKRGPRSAAAIEKMRRTGALKTREKVLKIKEFVAAAEKGNIRFPKRVLFWRACETATGVKAGTIQALVREQGIKIDKVA